MTSPVSFVAMTLLAGFMAAPLIADRLFNRDLLGPTPAVVMMVAPAGTTIPR